MKIISKCFSLLLACGFLLLVPKAQAAKKFRRALIIAGGSVTPAVGIGIVEGLRAQGKAPDVIITTCGSSLAAMAMNSYGSPKNTLDYVKSEHFHWVMKQLKPHSNVIQMALKFKHLEKTQALLPDIFSNALLSLPESFKALPNANFDPRKRGPKFIIQASKALFFPENVGSRRASHLFQQVYFTDSNTASALRKTTSAVSRLFPNSYVRRDVKVISNVRSDDAARAGIADPFLLNPAKINGEYYFTGAVDLIPLELAHQLADEVISTYPQSLFEEYEDLVVKNTFGFKQTDRVLKAILDKKVRWIDVTGQDDVNLEPVKRLLGFVSQVPRDLGSFQNAMQSQFDFGYVRAKEAVKAKNNFSHLRTPINPKLAYSFTCYNANVWKTKHSKNCTSDAQFGCDRQRYSCSPVR